MKVKNNTLSEQTWCGQEIQANAYYEIQKEELVRWQQDPFVETCILNSDLTVNTGNIDIEDPIYGLRYLKNDLYSSIAVDKDATDQTISGTDWTVIEANRILWDIDNNYDTQTHDILVPFNGLWSFDCQIKLKDLVNVDAVELALFLRQSPQDDYWFILDKKFPGANTEAQLNGSTMFDFRLDERYCLKIKLYGTNPSATISGEDDYTAWGYDYRRQYE